MGKDQKKDLLQFLKPFDADKKALLLWLRDFAWDQCKQANEIIYDNYNAVALGWTISGRLGHTFCSVAIIRSNQNIHFGFYWGKQLSDPDKKLLGQGNQYRYLLVTDQKSFPKNYVKKLIGEAYVNVMAKVKDEKQLMQGQTIVKSISAKKRPARSVKSKPVKKKIAKRK